MPAVFFNALQYFATFCRALQYMVLQWLQQWVRARFLEVCSILGGLQYLQYSAGHGAATEEGTAEILAGGNGLLEWRGLACCRDAPKKKEIFPLLLIIVLNVILPRQTKGKYFCCFHQKGHLHYDQPRLTEKRIMECLHINEKERKTDRFFCEPLSLHKM